MGQRTTDWFTGNKCEHPGFDILFKVQIMSFVWLHKPEIVHLCCTIWKANDSMWICVRFWKRKLICKSCFHQSKWQNLRWLRWEIRIDSPTWLSLEEWSDIFFSVLYLIVSQAGYCNWAFLPYVCMTVFVNRFYYLLACSLHHAIDKWFLFFLPQSLEHRIRKGLKH